MTELGAGGAPPEAPSRAAGRSGPRLDKQVVARAFQHDCDRELGVRLWPRAVAAREGIAAAGGPQARPGLQLLIEAGRAWEERRYRDLLWAFGPGRVRCEGPGWRSAAAGGGRGAAGGPFRPTDLLAELRRPAPREVVIEGEFAAPARSWAALRRLSERHGLALAALRPDVVWLRRFPTGLPLLREGGPAAPPEFELHVVDAKLAAEPSARHHVEVTLYALGLDALLREAGLDRRYAVAAAGFLWPGGADEGRFREAVAALRGAGEPDPAARALERQLQAVPLEVYGVHVERFLAERLPRVLATRPRDLAWFVSPRCYGCENLAHCREEAERRDHLSRLPGLTRGQAALLEAQGIRTVAALREAGRRVWPSPEGAGLRLAADGPALAARAEALVTGQPVPVPERRSGLMPRWADLRLYTSLHRDPGSGLVFAIGASAVYFRPAGPDAPPAGQGQRTGPEAVEDGRDGVPDDRGAERGADRGDLRQGGAGRPDGRAGEAAPPGGRRAETERRVLVVGRRDLACERRAFLAYLRFVNGWLARAAAEGASAHFYFWDALHLRQLRGLLERHMGDPAAAPEVEPLLGMFPPESVLPDVDQFRTQPGTLVHDVLRALVGLPLPHAYTPLEAAAAFDPPRLPSGEPYRFAVPWGFGADLTAQIAFERAYELWGGRVSLRPLGPGGRPGAPLTRRELVGRLRRAAEVHLSALEHLVRRLEGRLGERLAVRKAPLQLRPAARPALPRAAQALLAAERLEAIASDQENRRERALPLEEREARFLSMRGLRPVDRAGPLARPRLAARVAEEVRREDPRYAGRRLLVCALPPSSRDARIKAGDSLLALWNGARAGGPDGDRHGHRHDLLDRPWRRVLDLSFDQALRITRSRWWAGCATRKLLQVEVADLRTGDAPPLIVLAPLSEPHFALAEDLGLVDLDRPLVLDPVYEDHRSGRVEAVLRAIGGPPAPRSPRVARPAPRPGPRPGSSGRVAAAGRRPPLGAVVAGGDAGGTGGATGARTGPAGA